VSRSAVLKDLLIEELNRRDKRARELSQEVIWGYEEFPLTGTTTMTLVPYKEYSVPVCIIKDTC